MRFIYSKTFVRGFVAFVIIAFLVVADARGYTASVKNLVLKTYGSAVNVTAQSGQKVKNFFSVFFAIRKLVSENNALNQQLDELAFENARLKLAQQENLTLRRALKFNESFPLDLLPVEVQTSDPTGFSQTLTIDKGESHGVREGAAVVSAPGILVGRISRIYPGSAVVTLITDPSMLVNAETADSGARGLIKGEHGTALAFDLITQNELIKPEDRVITSGISGDYPRGLLIGQITTIRTSPSELFQKAFVIPAADLKNLRILFVLGS